MFQQLFHVMPVGAIPLSGSEKESVDSYSVLLPKYIWRRVRGNTHPPSQGVNLLLSLWVLALAGHSVELPLPGLCVDGKAVLRASLLCACDMHTTETIAYIIGRPQD